MGAPASGRGPCFRSRCGASCLEAAPLGCSGSRMAIVCIRPGSAGAAGDGGDDGGGDLGGMGETP